MSSNSVAVCVKLGLKYQGKQMLESWLTEESNRCSGFSQLWGSRLLQVWKRMFLPPQEQQSDYCCFYKVLACITVVMASNYSKGLLYDGGVKETKRRRVAVG